MTQVAATRCRQSLVIKNVVFWVSVFSLNQNTWRTDLVAGYIEVLNVLVTLFLFGADLDLVSLVLPTDRFLVEAFWFLTTRRLEPACVRPERRGLT